MADPRDQRGRRRRGAEIEGEEGSGIRHQPMLPARDEPPVGPDRLSDARRQASQVDLFVESPRAARSAARCPASSARISVAPANSPPNRPLQHRIEEQHRVRAERPVRPARLEEVDRRARSGRGAGSRGRPARRARRAAPRSGSYGKLTRRPRCEPADGRRTGRRPRARPRTPGTPRRRASRRSRARSYGDWASSSRTALTVTRAASSSGNPPTPVPSAGKAMLVTLISRARAIALRTAASMIVAARPAVAVERDGVDHELGGEGAGRRHDRVAERDRRLADGRELDRIAAGPLDRAADARRHPQRQVGRVHDRVDLEVADVPVPEFDPSHRVLRRK